MGADRRAGREHECGDVGKVLLDREILGERLGRAVVVWDAVAQVAMLTGTGTPREAKPVQELKDARFNAKELRDAKFSLGQLKRAWQPSVEPSEGIVTSRTPPGAQ